MKNGVFFAELHICNDNILYIICIVESMNIHISFELLYNIHYVIYGFYVPMYSENKRESFVNKILK